MASHETVRVTRDGRHVPISLTVSPILDAEGRVVGASAIGRDITNTRRVEAALRSSEERHRSIIDSAMDAILMPQPYQDGHDQYNRPVSRDR